MTDSASRQRSPRKQRSTVQLRPPRQPRRLAGLISHVLPVAVLAIGVLWWMSTISTAQAQVAQPQFSAGQIPASQYGGQFQNGRYGNQPQYSATPGQPAFRTAMQPGTGQGQASALQGGIPAVPATGPATEQIGAEGSAEDDAEAGWFQTPALIGKVMSGGWLMMPLAICSLVVLSLSFERLVALRRGRVIPRPFVQRFTECVEDGVLSYDEATELCKEFDCPVSEVFRAALRRWGRPMFEIEQAVLDAGDRVSDGLRKYLRVFHAISNVAPLIGLLGTVIGMIDAFEVISDQSSIGRPETLASGISMALMTTAGGLAVAIPAYLAYMYFSSKSDRYLGEIERLCQRVIDCISAEGLEENGGATRNKRRKAA
ncbi:Biopolymer transport protein ExbB [Stieleria maiorica]|uniref:Biopolymer transport protein ExbB n=1 Tax=Stieleria maiorica TaxID=2795974 RepID=A0A5B9MGH3_9BACT|nr:MotA/TolQ/ExbB proton channel family protein [Stieleria maiorica]QEF99599.1 Biopolymer transport protein ExbB [Stieleria maiorica]